MVFNVRVVAIGATVSATGGSSAATLAGVLSDGVLEVKTGLS